MNNENSSSGDDNSDRMQAGKADNGTRLDIATRIFNVDAQLTSHFETVRMHFLVL